MPQPLRPPSKHGAAGPVVHYGPNKILERPELAAQIGNIIANWTLIEDDLLNLYALLMGDYLNIGPDLLAQGFTAPPSHPVARQVFNEVSSLTPRLNLIDSLCEWRGTKEESQAFRTSLKPEIRKLSAKRNEVVHNGWGVCDAYPDALILSQIFGQAQIYKRRDFEQISIGIIELHSKLNLFSGQIFQTRLQRNESLKTSIMGG